LRYSSRRAGKIPHAGQAAATVTQVAPDTIKITGCRAGIFCQTLTFNRV
jgi:hypothetical protein